MKLASKGLAQVLPPAKTEILNKKGIRCLYIFKKWMEGDHQGWITKLEDLLVC